VLKFAQAEDRVLLTFDKDFGELAFVTELPATSDIILFRIQSPSSIVLTEKIVTATELRDDWVGHFSTIDNNKIPMREV
jgi:predicted nuclease of predicted toxin-antitoxin system